MTQKLFGSKQQLAVMLNLTPRRITDLVAAKIVPPRGPKGFDLIASVQGYLGFIKSKTGSLTTERTRHAKLKSDLLELQLGVKNGELVEVAAVEKMAFTCYRRARDKFQNLPARLSGILAAESSQEEVFRQLTEEIHTILMELSSDTKRVPS